MEKAGRPRGRTGRLVTAVGHGIPKLLRIVKQELVANGGPKQQILEPGHEILDYLLVIEPFCQKPKDRAHMDAVHERQEMGRAENGGWDAKEKQARVVNLGFSGFDGSGRQLPYICSIAPYDHKMAATTLKVHVYPLLYPKQEERGSGRGHTSSFSEMKHTPKSPQLANRGQRHQLSLWERRADSRALAAQPSRVAIHSECRDPFSEGWERRGVPGELAQGGVTGSAESQVPRNPAPQAGMPPSALSVPRSSLVPLAGQRAASRWSPPGGVLRSAIPAPGPPGLASPCRPPFWVLGIRTKALHPGDGSLPSPSNCHPQLNPAIPLLQLSRRSAAEETFLFRQGFGETSSRAGILQRSGRNYHLWHPVLKLAPGPALLKATLAATWDEAARSSPAEQRGSASSDGWCGSQAGWLLLSSASPCRTEPGAVLEGGAGRQSKQDLCALNPQAQHTASSLFADAE
ncbi:hypothetical protein J0S82_001824 [Galemys pyrenaicus]|uniref:Uncharacterized protein n=1 Tax=Galemys pyrenaicus TaxID=202257 RepID=A0A8J6AAA8_GALPY|nr:hypothetical protein J0S82_001824 [Galemys pyrenaicus]